MPGTAPRRRRPDKLDTFAARPGSAARSSTSRSEPAVPALNAQADANHGCPYAKNLVAEAIKDIVDSYRTPTRAEVRRARRRRRRDPVLPLPRHSAARPESGFTRRARQHDASQASLQLDYVLSQDAYGATTRSRSDAIVPGAGPRGRPAGRDGRPRSSAMIDAYLAATNGVVSSPTLARHRLRLPGRRGDAVKDELAAGIGSTPDTLIHRTTSRRTDPAAWTATAAPQLWARASRPDLPRRPLQRQQRAWPPTSRRTCSRPSSRPRRRTHELDRVQRRLPLRLQHRRRRRDAAA